MTSYVEQDRRPRRIQWRLALGAIAGILALGIVWLPSHEGTALLVLKVGCTLTLWGFVLTELAVTGHRVRQARKAERRAEHTRRVLAEALDALPQAVAIFDPADRPILVNQRFSELQGTLSPTAGAGSPGDTSGNSERSLPDGRWVKIDGHHTRNGYRIAVSSDVTELKRQKAELARLSRLLEATLSATDRGICIWGPDGRLTMWNEQVAGLLDLPAGLLTAGRSFAEFEAFLKACGEAALASTAAAAEPGKVSRAQVRYEQYEHVRPDGHVLDVIHTSLPDGGRMISYGDITSFRRVERDLREGKERSRRLSSATREGVQRIVKIGSPDTNADAAIPDDAQADTVPPDTARRLLLVEDSVTNQLVASTLLKIAGYRVDIASNGMEAVNAVKSTPFDLVLMDIAMPEMDGITATKAIRALPAPAGRTPIIAMTANAMVGDRERFLDAGMNDYVPKPIERPYLLATIARWLPAPPAALDQPPGGAGAMAIPPIPAHVPANEPQQDDVLDIAVLEQLKHDLDEIVLPDLIGAFLSEARQRSRRIAEGIATGNLSIIEREAHTLKSSAGTFGAIRLARSVQTLERTCQEADLATVRRMNGAVLALVDEAADAYRALGLISAPVTQAPVT